MIEAVAEDLETKVEIFRELDRFGEAGRDPRHDDLVAPGGRPGRGYLPAGTRGRTSLLQSGPGHEARRGGRTVTTGADVEKRCTAWVRSIGKRPVRCRDRAGFIVNFLLFPYLNDAVRMHEEGYGSP